MRRLSNVTDPATLSPSPTASPATSRTSTPTSPPPSVCSRPTRSSMTTAAPIHGRNSASTHYYRLVEPGTDPAQLPAGSCRHVDSGTGSPAEGVAEVRTKQVRGLHSVSWTATVSDRDASWHHVARDRHTAPQRPARQTGATACGARCPAVTGRAPATCRRVAG